MLGENGTKQTGVKRPKQKVAKKSVAEAVLAVRELEEARGSGEAGGTRESSPTARDPGELAPAAKDLGEPAPATEDPGEGRNRGTKKDRRE